MIRTVTGALLVWVFSMVAVWAQARDNVAVYMFANSLVNHPTEGGLTNVPHWLNALARADGRGFSVAGQFMFLKNLPAELPPKPTWSFPGVPRLNLERGKGFAASGVNTVLLNPENFVQYRAANLPYEWDNPGEVSPLGATLAAFDAAGPGAGMRFVIYEGWSDMAEFVRRFPPNARQLRRYHAFNRDDQTDWYEDYVAQLRAARPALDIRLIPVARVLADLLSERPLADLPATEFYSDDAPHGTANLYFLAAMITYAGLYDAPPPEGFAVPGALHSQIAKGYPVLRDVIWRMVSEFEQAEAGPAVDPVDGLPIRVRMDARQVRVPVDARQIRVPVDALPIRASLELAAGGARPTAMPALAMGLNGIADWSTQHPFLDLMKTSRGWIGHKPGQWGGMEPEEMWSGGYLDAQGWPVRMPEGIERLEALILTEQPEDAQHLSGRYLVRYDGRGELSLTGRARQVSASPNTASFSYAPGDGLVGIAIRATDPDDPIRNIRVIREDMLPLYEAGVIFNPEWIRRIADLRSVRFMDWMATNGSTQVVWDDRPRVADASYTRRGVPVEVMLALANQIGADPWFTLPHMADDAYVRRFAEAVRDGLDPRLKAYVEYSNEVWNFIFPQAHWAQAQAKALWGDSDGGWMQFYGLRAAQVMDLFAEVFAGEGDRLQRVVAVHTGWPGLEDNVLHGPVARAELGHEPGQSFDAYAVSGYFGHGFAGEDSAARINRWLDASEAQAAEAGAGAGLQRVALREYVRPRRFDAAFGPAQAAVREGSLTALMTELWPHHARVARDAGLDLIMYEGGTHITGEGALIEDQRLTEFLNAFSYTPEMAQLYQELLTGWSDLGGHLFNAFVDVAGPSKWGSWGALRHLDDANPRWDVLMAHNANGPADWQDRDPAAFADGVMLSAADTGAVLEGTAEEDILLGGPGDDVLSGLGGDDHLQGGPGQDRAILPGRAADYSFGRGGVTLRASGPRGVVQMAGIETLEFSGEPGVVLSVDGL